MFSQMSIIANDEWITLYCHIQELQLIVNSNIC